MPGGGAAAGRAGANGATLGDRVCAEAGGAVHSVLCYIDYTALRYAIWGEVPLSRARAEAGGANTHTHSPKETSQSL